MAGNATPHGVCLGLPSRRSQRRPRGPEAEPPGAGLLGCPEGWVGPLSLGGLGGLSLSWRLATQGGWAVRGPPGAASRHRRMGWRLLGV